MKTYWRAPLALCALAAMAAATLADAHAQGAQDAAQYPNRPVRITVGTGAGGAADTTARSAARTLSEILGQSFVVDNRPGAQGLVALRSFMKEPPDGYNLWLFASSQATLPAFYDLPFDPTEELTPISRLTIAPTILVVNPALPVKSVAELVAYAKANPGKISFGYQGGPVHLACAAFAKLANFEATGVPYKASALVTTDMIAGRITYTVMTAEQAKPLIEAGKLRALATAGRNRALAFPNLPTIAESGYPAYGEGWFGLAGPRNLPQPIIDKVHGVFKDHFFGKDPEKMLIKRGMEPAREGPKEFADLVKQEVARWSQVGKDIGIKRIKQH